MESKACEIDLKNALLENKLTASLEHEAKANILSMKLHDKVNQDPSNYSVGRRNFSRKEATR